MDDDARAAERRADAALVERARAEDAQAFGELYDRWFDRVHDLAFRVTHDAAAAGDVAQDTFLAAWQKLATLRDVEAFGGWLLRIARNAALDRLRRDQRVRPHDAEGLAVIEAGGPSAADAPAGFRVEDRTVSAEDPVRAAEDGELVSLVWESAAALGTRDAEVLDLMLRHGLEPAEIGEVVGLNRNAANQAVHRARSRLKAAVEARVLWRSGEPVCAGLAGALEGAGVRGFGAEAVRVTTRHAEGCGRCQEHREMRLEPSRLFAATPLLTVPVLLKAKVAHALSETGVPMQGSQALTPGSPVGSAGGRGHPWARSLAGAGTLLVVVGITTVALAERLDEARVEVSAVVPTTLAPTTTTSTPETTTTMPRALTPIVTVPTPVPVQVAATAALTISPSPVPHGYSPGQVQATWSTSGGATVGVTGPEGQLSSSPSGAAPVCPAPGLNPNGGPACASKAGSFTYTVTVRDAGGSVVAQASATLTTT